MNESLQNVSESNPKETREIEKQSRYAKAIERYNELKAVVNEAGEYIFREKPAVGKEQQTIAKLQVEIDGCLGEVEVCSEKGDPDGEKVMQMIAQFKEAEKELLSIYFDARNSSPELARILEEDFSFFGEVKKGDGHDTRVEFE